MLWYCLVPGMGLDSKSWNHLLHFGILFLVLYPIFHFLSFPSLWSQHWIKSHSPQLSAVMEWSYVYHFTLEAWTVCVYGYKKKLSVWNSIHLSLSECNSLWTISLFLLFSVLVFSLCVSCFELCWRVSTWAPALDPTNAKVYLLFTALEGYLSFHLCYCAHYSDTQNSTERRPWPLPSPL